MKYLADIDIGKYFKIGSKPISDVAIYKNLGSFISSLLPNVYVIAGIILFFLLIGGGLAIITSSDDPQKKEQGVKRVTAAITGFLIIITSWWLIEIIEIITGVNILKFTGG